MRTGRDFPSVTRDWRVQTERNVTNILPPDESGAITLSAPPNTPTDDESLKRLIDRVYGQYEQSKPMQAVVGDGWEGFRWEYIHPDQHGRRAWIVIIARRGSTVVMATANDVVDQMQIRRSTYEAALKSFKLRDPVSGH